MPSFSHTNDAKTLRLQIVGLSLVSISWIFVGCVDLTQPWNRVTAQGGTNGGAGGNGGTLGPAVGGSSGGIGGAIDAPLSGTGGAIDAPLSGTGGAIDAGTYPSTGGVVGTGGASADAPLSGSGGAAGGIDGGSEVSPVGTGGVTGTGGKTSLDAAPDLAPDRPPAPPDTSTLGSGLLAYYPCESASGTTLPDTSGNGNNGTLSATGTSFGAGKVGTMALTPDQKDEFFEDHLPHRLCLLMAFRDRQPWFKERIGQKDCDLLQTSKGSAARSVSTSRSQ